MKFEFSRNFLLGMAVAGLLTGCGGSDSTWLNAPDNWGEAPMPGETARPVSAEAPEAAPKVAASDPEEAAEPDSSVKSWWGGKKDKKDKKKETASDAWKTPPPTPEAPEAAAPKLKSKGGYPIANRVKSMSGYVYSPYDNRFISVKGVPSGSLVADPRYALDQKKYFIVP